jgi:hypothetical protein
MTISLKSTELTRPISIERIVSPMFLPKTFTGPPELGSPVE